jgi:hypothetical protein
MWFERFVIIVTSLADDYLAFKLGTISHQHGWIWESTSDLSSLFMTLFLLFCSFLPGTIAIAEVKSVFRTSSEVAKRERALKDEKQNGGFVGHTTFGILDKDDK